MALWQARCFDCPKGQFSNLDASNGGNADGNANCPLCPTGKFQEKRAEDHCETCYTCVGGKFRKGCGAEGGKTRGVCVSCETGFFKPTNGTSYLDQCEGCPFGKYTENVASLDCTKCDTCNEGHFRDGCGVTAPRNSKGYCRDCSVGTFKPDDGAAWLQQNLPREVDGGKWEAKCFKCAKGQHQDHGEGFTGDAGSSNGQSSCKDCPKGQFQDTEGNEFCRNCQPCAAGTFRVGCGGTTPVRSERRAQQGQPYRVEHAMGQCTGRPHVGGPLRNVPWWAVQEPWRHDVRVGLDMHKLYCGPLRLCPAPANVGDRAVRRLPGGTLRVVPG